MGRSHSHQKHSNAAWLDRLCLYLTEGTCHLSTCSCGCYTVRATWQPLAPRNLRDGPAPRSCWPGSDPYLTRKRDNSLIRTWLLSSIPVVVFNPRCRLLSKRLSSFREVVFFSRGCLLSESWLRSEWLLSSQVVVSRIRLKSSSTLTSKARRLIC
jgi:hypothetical protein